MSVCKHAHKAIILPEEIRLIDIQTEQVRRPVTLPLFSEDNQPEPATGTPHYGQPQLLEHDITAQPVAARKPTTGTQVCETEESRTYTTNSIPQNSDFANIRETSRKTRTESKKKKKKNQTNKPTPNQPTPNPRGEGAAPPPPRRPPPPPPPPPPPTPPPKPPPQTQPQPPQQPHHHQPHPPTPKYMPKVRWWRDEPPPPPIVRFPHINPARSPPTPHHSPMTTRPNGGRATPPPPPKNRITPSKRYRNEIPMR